MTIACLVTVRNEEKTIRQVLECAAAFPWDVYLVDNGSTDKTSIIGKGLVGEYNNVHYLFEPNVGKANGLRTGFRSTLEYEIVCTMDGDGEHKAEDIYKMSRVVPEGGMIVGNRFHDRGFNEMPLKDLLIYAIVNHYTKATHKDPRCGARAYSSELIKTLLPRVKAEGHGFDLGLYYEALLDDRKIRSYPIEYTKREERVYTSEGELSKLLGLEFASEELEDICRVFGRDVGEGRKFVEDHLFLILHSVFME